MRGRGTALAQGPAGRRGSRYSSDCWWSFHKTVLFGGLPLWRSQWSLQLTIASHELRLNILLHDRLVQKVCRQLRKFCRLVSGEKSTLWEINRELLMWYDVEWHFVKQFSNNNCIAQSWQMSVSSAQKVGLGWRHETKGLMWFLIHRGFIFYFSLALMWLIIHCFFIRILIMNHYGFLLRNMLFPVYTHKSLIPVSFSANLSDVSVLPFQVNECNTGFLETSLICTFRIKFYFNKYWKYTNIIFKNPSKLYFLSEQQTQKLPGNYL